MKMVSRTLILSLTFGLLAACQPKESTLTEAGNGRAETVKVGENLVIELLANPSTGFTWEVAEVDTNVLQQVGETEFKSSSLTPLPGAGGTQTLRFQAVAPGRTELKLIYHRPFEKDTPPARTFAIQVTVEK
jgi:inhibitor of cysteine peptidase